MGGPGPSSSPLVKLCLCQGHPQRLRRCYCQCLLFQLPPLLCLLLRLLLVSREVLPPLSQALCPLEQYHISGGEQLLQLLRPAAQRAARDRVTVQLKHWRMPGGISVWDMKAEEEVGLRLCVRQQEAGSLLVGSDGERPAVDGC